MKSSIQSMLRVQTMPWLVSERNSQRGKVVNPVSFIPRMGSKHQTATRPAIESFVPLCATIPSGRFGRPIGVLASRAAVFWLQGVKGKIDTPRYRGHDTSCEASL